MDNIMHFEHPPDLVIEFFVNFSRFEYALKRAGFLEETEDAKVKWNSFADKIRDQFEAHLNDQRFENFKEAVDYLLHQPPRKLVVNTDGEKRNLCWKISDPNRGNQVRDVLILVARIRNNLFHGEKPGIVVGGTGGIRERDIRLIQYSLVIIDICVGLNSDVS